MPSPLEEFKRAIAKWEGEWQAQPQDAGNYVTLPDGSRKLIGTQRGVTPAAYAAWKGLQPWDVTVEMMQGITLEEAAQIGLRHYYEGTGLDRLPWGPATSALVDVGWGSGPRQAVLFAQRLCGAVADGVVGPRTIEMYAAWVAAIGWPEATRLVANMRRKFYDLIIAKNPKWQIYRQGWHNRANWQTPENAEWWAPWQSAPPPVPAVLQSFAELPPVGAPPPVMPPRDTPSDSSTVRGSNAGQIAAAIGGTAAAASPIVQTIGGLDWRVAAVLGVVAVVGIGAAIYYLVNIKRTRVREISLGAGD